MAKRILSVWFPRLPSDRVLRTYAIDAALQDHSSPPFVVVAHQQNTNRVYCLNPPAERLGIHRGMSLSDARAYCPELVSRPADPAGDQRFLQILARWAQRFCPWVGLDGQDGLLLNISGAAHLFGGEAALVEEIRQRLARQGLTARIAVADTRGAAWALAHYGRPGNTDLRPLPLAALRLTPDADTALQRVGLRTIGNLMAMPRAAVARRFGAEVLLRLDQALGDQDESITPLGETPHYGVRMMLPEPIGLSGDVRAGTERLLHRLCAKLKANDMGARQLLLTLRRVDQGAHQVELRLAVAMRDPLRILPLFERGIDEVDAGFGIDLMRIEATVVEPQPVEQLSHNSTAQPHKVEDLVTRIGNRVGLDHIHRFLPADSHIPERSYQETVAAYSEPDGAWPVLRPRPVRLFSPEAIAAHGPRPPVRFRWRRMSFATARFTGPERIAPEWWLPDDNWRSGLRDYWQVETRQGRRLWMFYTPQNPGWYIQGEFP